MLRLSTWVSIVVCSTACTASESPADAPPQDRGSESQSLPVGETTAATVSDGGRWFVRGGARITRLADGTSDVALSYSGVLRASDQGMFGTCQRF